MTVLLRGRCTSRPVHAMTLSAVIGMVTLCAGLAASARGP